MDTDEEAVQPQQANQRGTMDSPIIIQESRPLGSNSLPTLNSSTEAEKLPLYTEPMENTMRIGCESSVTGCSNPRPVHSEIPAPGKSGLKTHFFGNSRPQGDPTRRRPTKDSGMHDSNKTVKKVTCNIEGAISNKHYLEKLCKENHIICIQEHWLWKFPKHWLDENLQEVNVFSCCHDTKENIPNVNIPRGRSGVAIIWQNGISDKITKLDASNERVIAIEVNLKIQLCIINVYMPTNKSNSEFGYRDS